MERTLVVIGGGASGIFCAVNAARIAPQLQVIVLEKTGKLLSKVRISGGGRCNVTHHCHDIAEMASRYPRGKNFVRKSFHRFFTNDTIEWFRDRGVALKAESDGRMFPTTDDSATIVNCLMREADRYGVIIQLHTSVSGLQKQNNSWIVHIERSGQRDTLQAAAVMVSTGGHHSLLHYDWLKTLGHSVNPPIPSLFTFNAPGNPLNALMGVAVPDAEVRIPYLGKKERGPVLITHWGLSGPAVIRLSAWLAREMYDVQYKVQVFVNWIPIYNRDSLKDYLISFRAANGTLSVRGKNPFGLPQRLWEFFVQASGIGSENWASITATQQNRLITYLIDHEIPISGKTTFKEEFVTAGGVAIREVNPDTMESRICPDLYFAGEVLDVDGITGGYNFQHAWTSGYIAAVDIAGKSVH